MSNYVRNFGVKNYQNQTTIPQLIANNMSGYFFLKHRVLRKLYPHSGKGGKIYHSKLTPKPINMQHN